MAQTYAEHLAKVKECNKRTHDERIRWGLCIRCGKPLNGVTTFQCAACLAKQTEHREKNREANREWQRKRVADHRARGLCVHCDSPAVPNGYRCEYHRDYYKKLDRNWRRRKVKNADE